LGVLEDCVARGVAIAVNRTKAFLEFCFGRSGEFATTGAASFSDPAALLSRATPTHFHIRGGWIFQASAAGGGHPRVAEFHS